MIYIYIYAHVAVARTYLRTISLSPQEAKEARSCSYAAPVLLCRCKVASASRNLGSEPAPGRDVNGSQLLCDDGS